MKVAYHLAPLRRLRHGVVLLLLLAIILVSFALTPTGSAMAAPTKYGSQFEGVQFSSTNQIRLNSESALTAVSAAPYARYGFYISPIQTLQMPGSRVTLAYQGAAPGGSTLELDVRASYDGSRWTAWKTGLADGATVDFPITARMVQYRARLFGSAEVSPTLSGVQVQAVPGYRAQQAAEGQVAPTFRVRGTRQGMIGGRTANGHIIRPRDHFVSLPSWSSLSTRGGDEYQVRITYQGRSAVAPVYDVGPWNTRDNYWDKQHERIQYPDLPQGWPQDHAAYFDGHNGGYAQYGYVRFPTAIDVGDGVWWDELGIRGDQAEVEVTFLWLGHDPMAAEPPSQDPEASQYTVNELGPAFIINEQKWKRSAVGCGENEHAFWTTTVTNSAQEPTHRAFWQPDLPIAGLYDVYVHVPICPTVEPVAQHARYLVQHQEGTAEIPVDQTQQTGWVLLGRFPFAASNEGFVYLTNLANNKGRTIWFDDARWVPVRTQ